MLSEVSYFILDFWVLMPCYFNNIQGTYKRNNKCTDIKAHSPFNTIRHLPQDSWSGNHEREGNVCNLVYLIDCNHVFTVERAWAVVRYSPSGAWMTWPAKGAMSPHICLFGSSGFSEAFSAVSWPTKFHGQRRTLQVLGWSQSFTMPWTFSDLYSFDHFYPMSPPPWDSRWIAVKSHF